MVRGDDDYGLQAHIMVRALDIYDDRSEVRGQLWKEYDEKDAAMHCRDKANRLMTAVHNGHSPLVVDDALDLINYAVFYIRHVEGLK